MRAGQFAETDATALAGLRDCPAAGLEEPLCASILLQNAADAEVALGRPAEAEFKYRRSLEVRRQGLPPNDPSIADAELRLGVFLRGQARLGEAVPVFAEGPQ